MSRNLGVFVLLAAVSCVLSGCPQYPYSVVGTWNLDVCQDVKCDGGTATFYADGTFFEQQPEFSDCPDAATTTGTWSQNGSQVTLVQNWADGNVLTGVMTANDAFILSGNVQLVYLNTCEYSVNRVPVDLTFYRATSGMEILDTVSNFVKSFIFG
jgi:hypothetical protein